MVSFVLLFSQFVLFAISRIECACPDVCSLTVDPGLCKAYFPRWYYNSTYSECRQFVYGGCDGNANRFESKEKCQAQCMQRCYLAPDPGLCKAYFPKWFYNSTAFQCQEFIYGGCDGNANRFDTKEDCEAKCSPPVCNLPPDSGLCKAYFPKWFFNATALQCQEFIYGGCDGNANRFDTLADCSAMCLN